MPPYWSAIVEMLARTFADHHAVGAVKPRTVHAMLVDANIATGSFESKEKSS